MKGTQYTSSQLKQSASAAAPQRIDYDGRKIINHAIINTLLSDQMLWIGVNTEEALEPIFPGGSKAMEARDDTYLRGFITLRWDDPTVAAEKRIGISTIGVDIGEIENC